MSLLPFLRVHPICLLLMFMTFLPTIFGCATPIATKIIPSKNPRSYANAIVDHGKVYDKDRGISNILGMARFPLSSGGTTLGSGWVIVDMGEGEEIVDIEGPDLRVYEHGSNFDPDWRSDLYKVFVSNDRITWHKLGYGRGTKSFDLSKAKIREARYIKIEGIVDAEDTGDYPGPEIDAIEALHMKQDEKAPEIVIVEPSLKQGISITTKELSTTIDGTVTDESGIRSVRINGEEVSLDGSGNFMFEVTLVPGENIFTVEAIDTYGNLEKRSFVVNRILQPHMVREEPIRIGPKLIEPVAQELAKKEKIVPPSEIGERYAVVIGIGRYKDNRIPKLKYTTVDAESVYSILIDPEYGNFPKNQVKLLINEQATDNNIKSAIGTWLRRNTRKDDTVIIFFAGHGAPEDEKTYWVTYNANIDDLYGTALSNDEIADMLDRVEANKMIAFLDSCYSAATVNRTDKKRSIMIKKDPFQKFKGKGRVIITSSDGKEESLEIEKFGHGVFTYYLLEALKGESDENKDGFVELDEVWDYVKYRVTDTSRKYGSSQTPIIDGSYSAGIVLSKHPERLKKLYLEAERERKEKELESKIAKLTELYSKGEITSSQFDKAVKILESGEKNKLLDDFLSDKISFTTFKRVFK